MHRFFSPFLSLRQELLPILALFFLTFACAAKADGIKADTQPATAITRDLATLKGAVTTGASAGIAHFEFSASGKFDDTILTADQPVSARSVAQPISADLTGLSELTTYFYRIVAGDGTNSAAGSILSFSTALYGKASVVGETTAEVSDLFYIRPGSFIYFDYSPRPDFKDAGSTAPREINYGSSHPLTVGESLSGLEPGTLYYLRSVQRYLDFLSIPPNATRYMYSTTVFVTAGSRSSTGGASAVTFPATNTGPGAATLAGKVNGFGEAQSAHFEYSFESSTLENAKVTPATPIAAGISWTAVQAPAVNLPGATTVYYRVVTEDSHGKVNGEIQSFTTARNLGATTLPAIAYDKKALLNGSVDTGVTAATAHFEYSASGRFDDTVATADQPVEAGASGLAISAWALSLNETSTYAFRVVATAGAKTSTGAILFLNTGFAGGLKEVGQTSATLLGSYIPWSSKSYSVYVEYSTTRDFAGALRTTSHTVAGYHPSLPVPNPVGFQDTIAGLQPGTTYYTRTVISYSEPSPAPHLATTKSDPLFFITAGTRTDGNPAILLLPAVQITDATALLQANVNDSGEASNISFEYATSADFSDARNLSSLNLGAGTSWNSIQLQASNLPAGTQLYYRAIMQNSHGVTVGDIASFVTSDGAPTMSNFPGSHLGANAAAFRARVTTGNKPTTITLQYSADPQFTNPTSILLPILAAGITAREMDGAITGLTASTHYYARFVVSNDAGASNGPVISFMTLPAQAPALTLLAPLQVYGYYDSTFRAPGAGATLQAVVIPNGYPTVVEFFLNGVSLGTVNAGAGTAARTVQRTFFAFPVTSSEADRGRTGANIITAKASNGQATETDALGVKLAEIDLTGTAAPLFPPLLGIAVTDISSNHALLSATPTVPPTGLYSGGEIFVEFFVDGVAAGIESAGNGSATHAVTIPLNNLQSATTFRITANVTNNYGTNVAVPLSFTTLSSTTLHSPLLTTLIPTAVTPTSAILRASVNPNGLQTSVEFFLDGISKGSVNVGNGSTSIPVELAVSGLSAATTYTITTRASSSAGAVSGEARQLTTNPEHPTIGAPVISTFEAGAITPYGATLRASVNPNGLQTSVEFFLDGISKGSVNAGSGSTSIPVELALSGLSAATTYTITTRASNSAGAVSGEARQLTTNPEHPTIGAPVISTLEAGAITPYAATLRARVNPNGLQTSVEFFLDGISKGSVNAGSGLLPIIVELSVHTQQVSGIRHEASSRASNASGTAQGGTKDFSSIVPTYTGSTITALSPQAITPVSATLRASLNPGGAPTTVEFFVDGISAGTVAAGSGLTPVTVELPLTGLTPQTLYSVSFFVSNNQGIRPGEPVEFMTTAFGGVSADPARGQFELAIYDNSTPPKPYGKLAISMAAKKSAFTGTFNFMGLTYRLRGAFDSTGSAVIELLPRTVKNVTFGQALHVSLTLSEDEHGSMRLRMKAISDQFAGAYFWADGAQLGSSSVNEALAGKRYTIILPMRDPDQLGTAQGDGYLAGRISSTRIARLVGRTGDGQSLAITGRLQDNGMLSVGQAVGSRPYDFIAGTLEFHADTEGSVEGDLECDSYAFGSPDYSRHIAPVGRLYIPPSRETIILPHSGSAATTVVTLKDSMDHSVVKRTLTNGRDNSVIQDNTAPGRVTIQVNRATGLFSGRVPLPGSKGGARFNGVLIPALNRGAGVVEFKDTYGAVELSAE